jgi:signal transduction histidine kinase
VLLGLWSIGRLAASWSAYRDRTLLLEFERVQAEERAEARERTRIARELHDVIAHTITVIVMQAGGARLASAGDRETAVDALARIEVLGRDSLAELRTLLQVLRDEGAESSTAPQPTLADVPALCGRMRSLGLPVRVRTTGGTDALPPGVQLAAYRIVQEGLTNVLKHAGIVDTQVDLQVGPGTLLVDVANAAGGDSERVPGSGRGLIGLRERVTALGGTLTSEPQQDGGYRLSAMLPVAVGTAA